MGSGIALGLGNAIGSLLVLAVGFAVHDTGDVLALFVVATVLSLVTVLVALAIPQALLHDATGTDHVVRI